MHPSAPCLALLHVVINRSLYDLLSLVPKLLVRFEVAKLPKIASYFLLYGSKFAFLRLEVLAVGRRLVDDFLDLHLIDFLHTSLE